MIIHTWVQAGSLCISWVGASICHSADAALGDYPVFLFILFSAEQTRKHRFLNSAQFLLQQQNPQRSRPNACKTWLKSQRTTAQNSHATRTCARLSGAYARRGKLTRTLIYVTVSIHSHSTSFHSALLWLSMHIPWHGRMLT